MLHKKAAYKEQAPDLFSRVEKDKSHTSFMNIYAVWCKAVLRNYLTGSCKMNAQWCTLVVYLMTESTGRTLYIKSPSVGHDWMNKTTMTIIYTQPCPQHRDDMGTLLVCQLRFPVSVMPFGTFHFIESPSCCSIVPLIWNDVVWGTNATTTRVNIVARQKGQAILLGGI